MKQAILVQCHKKPEQVNLLLNALDDPDLDIYIHIDKKSNIKSGIKAGQQIHILPDEYRVDVGWAVFSQVEATLNLMKYASAHGDYGHYVLCSGQDYPLVKASELAKFLNENTDLNFVQIWASKNGGGTPIIMTKERTFTTHTAFWETLYPKGSQRESLLN